jgi:putative hemolysin
MATDLVPVCGFKDEQHRGNVTVARIGNTEHYIKRTDFGDHREFVTGWWPRDSVWDFGCMGLLATSIHSNPVYGHLIFRRKQLIQLVDQWLANKKDEEAGIDSDSAVEAALSWRDALVQQGLLGIRRRCAAKVIQWQFRNSVSNPAHVMCKNRLQREFESLVSSA